jgi:hypothetical protein
VVQNAVEKEVVAPLPVDVTVVLRGSYVREPGLFQYFPGRDVVDERPASTLCRSSRSSASAQTALTASVARPRPPYEASAQ